MKSENQNTYNFLIQHWHEIVNFAEKKDKSHRQCITSSRPCKTHIFAIAKKTGFSTNKKEFYNEITNMIDYKRIIQDNGHIHLGVKGVEDYVEFHSKNGMWETEEVMENLKSRNLKVFQESPEDIQQRIEQSKKQRKTSKKKKKTKKKTEPKQNNVDKQKSKTQVKSGIVRPPTIKIPSKDEVKTITSKREVMKPSGEEENDGTIKVVGSISSINEEDSVKSKIVISKQKKKKSEEKVEEELLQEEMEEKDSRIEVKDLHKIVQSSLKMDSEYIHLVSILMKIKKENEGNLLKEDQILEKAKEIDPHFAEKFFSRMFRMSPFCELLKFRPTGFIM